MLMSRLSRRQGKNDPASLMDIAEIHVMLGLLLDATQRSDDAVMQYRMAITSSKKAFEFEPRYKGLNPQPWSVAAFMLYRRNGWADSDSEAKVAIETTCVPDVLAAANDDWKPRLELMFASLYWLAGEEDEYRKICRRWLDATDNPPAFSILARMVSLDPKCLEMRSDLLSLTPEVSPESSRNARESYGSLHHARGRVLYRTGHCELAIESLNKASDRTGVWGQRNPSHPPDALVHLDLALAHHFNGDPELAKDFLQLAIVELDSNELPWLFCDSGEAARLVLPFQLFEIEILRREAEELILNSQENDHGEAFKSPSTASAER